MEREPEIRLVFDDEGDRSPEERLRPDRMDINELFEYLKLFRQAIYHQADGIEVPRGEGQRPPVLFSLTAISEGSLACAGKATTPYQNAALQLAQAIATGDYAPVRPSAHRLLEKMGTKANKNGLKLKVASWVYSGEISRERPIPPSDAFQVRGTTTLYGKLLRLGGRKHRIQLELQPSGKCVTVQATRQIVKQLESEQRLYTVVGLIGTAAWRVGTMELVEFTVTQVLNYTHRPLLPVIEKLEAIANEGWQREDGDE